ncbi:MAG: YceI family protein [Holophagaceae bacterium]
MTLLSRLALLAVLALPAAAQTKVFEADTNHTSLGFKAATLLFKVDGTFRKWRTEITGNPDDPKDASVKVILYTNSISTKNRQRDEHLVTEDFFDAARYPRITFTSSKVVKEGGKVVVTGTLDMHGVRKELTIPFEPAFGKNGAGADTWSYEGTLKINRKDFGIGADSVAAKISLKDEVELNLLLVGFFEEPKEAAPKNMTPKAMAKAMGAKPAKAAH